MQNFIIEILVWELLLHFSSICFYTFTLLAIFCLAVIVQECSVGIIPTQRLLLHFKLRFLYCSYIVGILVQELLLHRNCFYIYFKLRFLQCSYVYCIGILVRELLLHMNCFYILHEKRFLQCSYCILVWELLLHTYIFHEKDYFYTEIASIFYMKKDFLVHLLQKYQCGNYFYTGIASIF